jgi:hypothetical protein
LNSKEEILEEIIKGYRKVLYNRYQYENIKVKYDIPPTIDEKTVDSLRDYYLAHIYPEYTQRKALNQAFESLDSFTKQPQKLLSILLDASRLIFKYGFHLPKILNTGLKALQTFKAAASFENTFVEEAIRKDLQAPFDHEKINELLKALSREEIDDFIATSQTLFDTLHHKKLVKKIKEVILHLLIVMRSKESTYTESQVKGLEIGYDLLNEGDKIFNKLTKSDQKKFIYLITDIEKDMLDGL